MTRTERDPQFEKLLEFLRLSRGFDFTGYKRTSLMRRVRKRMQTVGIDGFEGYLDHLEVHPDEFDYLFNTILINVTGFFRDEAAWRELRERVIPPLLADRPEEAYLRVWSAGCASGEEAYTLAIILAEALGHEAFRQRVKIYATDADEEALAQARLGSYGAESVQAVPQELRERYFERAGSRYTFRADLRRSVIFGRHDLVQDAPISHLDLLVCRNTLMYFNREVQARILARFHFALDGEGILFLGKAEMMLAHSELFRPVSLKHRIFARVPKVNLRDRLLVMAQAGNEDGGRRVAQELRIQETAFDVSPEAQLVVDASGKLVLANERARALFNLTGDALGNRFQDLKLSYQPIDLRTPLEKVLSERKAFALEDVAVAQKPEPRYMSIQLVPLVNNGGRMLGVSLVFQDVTKYKLLQRELERASAELETAYEELQSTNEELETTNEELQSTVEELETTNEELQSTNEELETMNEELQSTNEELETMNDELRRRTDEIDRMNAFLESILRSLRQGVVVLDKDFNIYVWNAHAEDLWGLRTDEVQGRSIFNLDTGLPIEGLKAPLKNCLSGDSGFEELKLEAVNRRGKPFTCRISCSRLDSLDDSLRGVILLMEEWRDAEASHGG